MASVNYEKVQCDKCHGTGYVFLIDKDQHESVGACDCEHGKQHPGLPVITKMFCKFDEMGRVKI